MSAYGFGVLDGVVLVPILVCILHKGTYFLTEKYEAITLPPPLKLKNVSVANFFAHFLTSFSSLWNPLDRA